MNSVNEWLHLHSLDPGIVRDCLAAVANQSIDIDLANFPHSDQDFAIGEFSSLPAALKEAVQPALAALLHPCNIGPLIEAIQWSQIDVGDNTPPHTIDHGVDHPPEIRIAWTGSAADLICLAHEVAHAIQLQLSAGSFMPPVARETCAFLGELALIDWATVNNTELAASLIDIWRTENRRYLDQDCDLLQSAAANPDMPYLYRMNYPLARIAAVSIFRELQNVADLFTSGTHANVFLPLDRVADLAARIENYLPPFPQPDSNRPAIDGYRALGAMALMDIELWKGETEQKIGDYYASCFHHLQTNRAFIALDDMRRPVGYATWQTSARDNKITLTRQCAPYGDHLVLHRLLERHLGQGLNVYSKHVRSAREVQAAW